MDGILDKSFSVSLVQDLVRESLWNHGLVGEPLRAMCKERVPQALEIMAENLANILNFWLEHREIPAQHLTSRLIMILKKPINTEQGNTLDDFRPISVTSIFYKLLEKILHRRIKALSNDSGIRPLNISQTGF